MTASGVKYRSVMAGCLVSSFWQFESKLIKHTKRPCRQFDTQEHDYNRHGHYMFP